jgi:hypothetical protein
MPFWGLWGYWLSGDSLPLPGGDPGWCRDIRILYKTFFTSVIVIDDYVLVKA